MKADAAAHADGGGGLALRSTRSSLASVVPLLTPQLLSSRDALATLREHTAFRGLALVHVDEALRVPAWPPDGRGKRHAAFVYNPSVLDDDSSLLKVSTYSYCSVETAEPSRLRERALSFASPREVARFRQAGRPLTVAPNRWVVWKRHGRIQQVIRYAEDPRAFRLDGRVHMLFTRRDLDGRKRVFLSVLEPEYAERALAYDGMRPTKDETNWVPIVVNGTELFVSYSLCPKHIVLRCDPASGQCTKAHQTSAPSTCRVASKAVSNLRGGSPMVPLSNALVAVAHRKEALGATLRAAVRAGPYIHHRYHHQLYAIAPQPPFAILALSEPFTFPAYFRNSSVSLVQFAAGAAVSRDALTLSYGVGDCAAFEVRVPLRDVVAALGLG